MLKVARYVHYVPTSVVHCLFLYRKHAKVSGEGAPQASNISNDEIEAAKNLKEWADLVLTDDDNYFSYITTSTTSIGRQFICYPLQCLQCLQCL